MLDFSLQKKLHTADGEMLLQVACKFDKGKFYCLYGQSGAGKTSVLRMLAGFMKPDDGVITMNDAVWYDARKRINVAPQQRKIGFVFQDYALFPNMNLRENIAFALSKDSPRQFVDELMDITGLTMLASRKILALSGGQQQRLALARAIATKPQLLLLDEPLSAIDSEMRAQLQTVLLQVHERFELTTLLVSHDMDEIIRLSNQVIHLDHGRIQSHNTPAAFFMNGSAGATVRGSVVSVEQGATVNLTILINNRLMKIDASPQDGKFSNGDEVEIQYHNAAPIIRKL